MDNWEIGRILIHCVFGWAIGFLYAQIRSMKKEHAALVSGFQTLTKEVIEGHVQMASCVTHDELRNAVETSHEKVKRILRNEEPA